MKNSFPTLEKISDLLDKKLGEFRLETNDQFREVTKQHDNHFEQLSGRLSGIEDRLGAQGDRIREMERGLATTRNLVYQKIGEIKEEINTLRGELNNRFEDSERNFERVLGKIQEFIGVTAESEDKKIIEHQFKFGQNEEKYPFATL